MLEIFNIAYMIHNLNLVMAILTFPIQKSQQKYLNFGRVEGIFFFFYKIIFTQVSNADIFNETGAITYSFLSWPQLMAYFPSSLGRREYQPKQNDNRNYYEFFLIILIHIKAYTTARICQDNIM